MTEAANQKRADHFSRHRLQMVENQLMARGLKVERVLAAMAEVPREEFLHRAFIDSADTDRPLPIACGQTILQPFTVAFMCETV